MENQEQIKHDIKELLEDTFGDPPKFKLDRLYNKHAEHNNLARNNFDLLVKQVHETIDYDVLASKKKEFLDENDGLNVKLLGETVYSFRRLGYLLFYNQNKALEFIEDNPKSLVNAISQSGNLDFSSTLQGILTENQSTSTIKYIKTLYLLNDKLPFRFETDWFSGVDKSELIYKVEDYFERIKINYDYFDIAYHIYNNGYLDIWLDYTFDHVPVKKINNTNRDDSESFLAFIYSNHANLPYYIDKDYCLENIDDVFEYLYANEKHYEIITHSLFDGFLSTWFLNNEVYAQQFNKWKKQYIDKGISDRNQAVEKLAQDLYNKEKPEITLEPNQIDLGRIPKDKKKQFALKVQLNNTGYLQGHISTNDFDQGAIQFLQANATKTRLNNQSNGEGDQNEQEQTESTGQSHDQQFRLVNFNQQKEQDYQEIKAEIIPTSFEFGKDYQKELTIETTEGQSRLPVTFRIIFPATYLVYELAKWGVMFGALFGIVRFIILSGGYSNSLAGVANLGQNDLMFWSALVLFICGLIGITLYLSLDPKKTSNQ